MITPDQQDKIKNLINSSPTLQPMRTTASQDDWYGKIKEGGYRVLDTSQTQTEDRGVLGNIANALTQSEQHLGQDIGRGILGGDKFQQGLVNQYEDNAKRLLQLASKQNSPEMQSKYISMAKGMVDDGVKAGEDFKGRTWEQIAGDVLGTAIDVGTTVSGLGLVKGAKAVTAAGKAEGIVSGALKGAKAGAKLGGMIGAGQGFAGGLQEDKNLLGVAGSTLKGGLIGGLTGGTVGAATGALPGIIDKGKSIIGKGLNEGKDMWGGKTLEQILSTPENDLYKLNAQQRGVYFNAQEENLLKSNSSSLEKKVASIKQKSSLLESKIKSNLENKSNSLVEETSNLSRQSEVAARDKVIEMKPKIIKSFGEQSKHYRNLVEEGMESSGGRNMKLDNNDLVEHIDNLFSNNPDGAAFMKNRFGLGGEDMKPTTTIGEIYDKVKSLKQDISKSGTRGSRAFTSADVETDKAINVLSGFLKNNGVDFSEANKFWSQYAPLRDKIISKVKPFTQTGMQEGIETSQMARILRDVASKKDVNNEFFIKQTEELLGEPLLKEQKAILSKLDNTAKRKIAAEIEAKTKLLENKMISKQGIESISKEGSDAAEGIKKSIQAQSIKVGNKAAQRDIIKKIFKGAGIIWLGKEAVNRF